MSAQETGSPPSLPTLCVLAAPPAPSLPKAPCPASTAVVLLPWLCSGVGRSVLPLPVLRSGESLPCPPSPPLRAAPFLPCGSEKLTNPQDGGHLSSLHPGPCSPALGFPSRPEGPHHPSTQPVSPWKTVLSAAGIP